LEGRATRFERKRRPPHPLPNSSRARARCRVGKLEELDRPEHRHLLDYYREFVKQPPEQLGGIRSTVFNYLQPYTTPDLAEVFCCPDPTFDVKELDEGRLITIKIPQKYQVEKKYISLLGAIKGALLSARPETVRPTSPGTGPEEPYRAGLGRGSGNSPCERGRNFG
jgi:hypothetical protein